MSNSSELHEELAHLVEKSHSPDSTSKVVGAAGAGRAGKVPTAAVSEGMLSYYLAHWLGH